MVIMTWCISESISESAVNNDCNLGDKILIYFDHSWTAWGALTFLLYEEYVPQTPIVFVRSGLSQTKSFWEDGEFYMSSDELITACSILVLCWNILSVLHTASHGLNPAFRLDQYFLHLFLSLSTQQQPLPFTFSNRLGSRNDLMVCAGVSQVQEEACSCVCCMCKLFLARWHEKVRLDVSALWTVVQALSCKLEHTNFQMSRWEGRTEAFCLPVQHDKTRVTCSEIERQ